MLEGEAILSNSRFLLHLQELTVEEVEQKHQRLQRLINHAELRLGVLRTLRFTSSLFRVTQEWKEEESAFDLLYPSSALKRYLRAVLKIKERGDELKLQSDWLDAIAFEVGCSATAPLNRFRHWGLIRANEGADDYPVFRERIENLAEEMRGKGEL